jgi:pimeloyl-ACP methyl ester carboxylesterase
MRRGFRTHTALRWRLIRGLLGGVAAAGLALSAVSGGPARPAGTGGPELHPCHIGGLSEEILCGRLEVFEDREARQGRRISLRFAILPSLAADPEPDPLFMLAGGPGQAATSLAPIAARVFRKIRALREIVLLDLRGTGDSHPLDCHVEADRLAGLLRPGLLSDPVKCLTGLDADVRRYSSFDAMEDLDEVREAFGYDRVNLWGGSYGTRAALVYLALHPERVRAAVLDGVAPFSGRFPLHTARDAQASLDRLIEECAGDEACRAAYPSFGAEIEGLLRSLEGSPARVTLRHPRTGREESVTITRDAFASASAALSTSPPREAWCRTSCTARPGATSAPSPRSSTVSRDGRSSR